MVTMSFRLGARTLQGACLSLGIKSGRMKLVGLITGVNENSCIEAVSANPND